GDVEVDFHHTIEDTGIVLGEMLEEAVDKEKIRRFGFGSIPMDEALSEVSLDFSGRNYLVINFPEKKVSGIDLRVFEHFFKSLSDNAGLTLHIQTSGEGPHHIIESTFKAFAVSLKEAVIISKNEGPRSTKGHL
ncbi:imidazoleglycerol-phosphate dehydratase, partial [archaeon SCG-AAA382B04]